MSKVLQFFSNDHSINISYIKKRYPSKSYTQSFLNIKVIPEGLQDPTYQVDLDDNHLLANFTSLSLFYNYLTRNKKKDIVMFNNSDLVTFMININDDIEEQIIVLNKVEMVDEEMYDRLTQRVDFYNDEFKTKIIHKIEKTVKSFYKGNKQKNQKKVEEKQKQKKPRQSGEALFTLKAQNFQTEYRLNQFTPTKTFSLPPSVLQQQQFKIKINSLKFDKIIIAVQYEDIGTNIAGQQPIQKPKDMKRVCQFGKSFNCSFCIEDGQQIGVSREEGELIIRNVTTNDGKIFDESSKSDLTEICRITVSLFEQ